MRGFWDKEFIVEDVEGSCASWKRFYGSFDFIICTQTIEHLRDPGELIRCLELVATQGFISVPHKIFELRKDKEHKEQLISDLRLTQSKALSGEKPSDCGVGPLSGHKLEFTSNSNYQITAVCDSDVVVSAGLSLTEGIIKQAGPDEIFLKS